MNCAACGAAALGRHLRVAGETGPQGLIPTTDRFGVALEDFLRCASCGHMQLAAMPSAAALAAGYGGAASDEYEAEEEGQRATARAELARLERHTPSRGRLVDLGCWVGFLASEAQRRGWDVVGVEPARWAAARARGRGVEVVEGPLLEADLPEGAFAAVTMGDVIEHLPDPGAALDRAARLLAPGGLLWMATPDAGSRVARALGRHWWSVIPTHVHLFTRRGMTLLLERHGFEVLEIGTSPKSFTVGYYLGRFGGYWPPLGRALVRVARALRLADRQWTLDLRDRCAVVAVIRSEPGGAPDEPGGR